MKKTEKLEEKLKEEIEEEKDFTKKVFITIGGIILILLVASFVSFSVFPSKCYDFSRYKLL